MAQKFGDRPAISFEPLESAVDGSEECSEDRKSVARFNAFYDFAFPRVYRYAQRRMGDDSRSQVLCRLVLIRALSSFGGLFAIESRMRHDPTDFAFGLFCLARGTADHLLEQLAEDPELLSDSCLESGLENWTLDLLISARAGSKSLTDGAN